MKNLWHIIRSRFSKSSSTPSAPTNEQTPVHADESSVATVDLTIGLDWGASCTKCIVRARYEQGDPAYVIDFGDLGFTDAPHLLPSRFFLTCGDSRNISFFDPDRTAEVIDATKFALLDESLDPGQAKDHQIRAVLYLAYAIRLIIKSWSDNWKNLYTGRVPYWSLNVGIPAAKMDESFIVKRFRQVALAAWRLSQNKNDNIDIHLAEANLNHVINEGYAASNDINVVPEVAAQVATYAQSSFRKDGLHALVDVGAATMDTAMFVLRRDENDDDVYSILSAKVDPYGAYQLHKTRHKSVRKHTGSQSESFSIMDIVPNDYLAYYPSDCSLDLSKHIESLLFDIDNFFVSHAKRSMHHVLHDVRKDKYPNAPEWKLGILFFYSGGGSHVNVYQKARNNLSYWWDEHASCVHPFDFRELQVPDNLHWKNSAGDFDRLSVAYGLSLPFVELGKARSPGEIAPVPKLDGPGPRRFANEDSKDWD